MLLQDKKTKPDSLPKICYLAAVSHADKDATEVTLQEPGDISKPLVYVPVICTETTNGADLIPWNLVTTTLLVNTNPAQETLEPLLVPKNVPLNLVWTILKTKLPTKPLKFTLYLVSMKSEQTSNKKDQLKLLSLFMKISWPINREFMNTKLDKPWEDMPLKSLVGELKTIHLIGCVLTLGTKTGETTDSSRY